MSPCNVPPSQLYYLGRVIFTYVRNDVSISHTIKKGDYQYLQEGVVRSSTPVSVSTEAWEVGVVLPSSEEGGGATVVLWGTWREDSNSFVTSFTPTTSLCLSVNTQTLMGGFKDVVNLVPRSSHPLSSFWSLTVSDQNWTVGRPGNDGSYGNPISST